MNSHEQNQKAEVPSLRLGLVIQRYGEEVNGGAEYHCRLVAEHLARRHHVEVLTSCARDYITWRNEHRPGFSVLNGVPVHRFRVKRARDPDRFGRLSQKVFLGRHSKEDELRWLEEQGPCAPDLVRYLKRRSDRYDYFVFFSYRYYHSYFGIQALPEKSLLVPTAEKDAVIDLGIFRTLFRQPRAIVYNSFEEREMIWQVSGNRKVKGDIVGVGSEVPSSIDKDLFSKKHGTQDRYAIYLGRVDQNKGCRLLFNYYRRYIEETQSSLRLVLVGGKQMLIPEDPKIYYAGFLSEDEKWSALAGAELLIMPSELESLSMVTLEAWAVGKPVLVNGRCDVLAGQCLRANAGLYFRDYYEFHELLVLLEKDSALRERLGQNGKRFFQKHYSWEVVDRKYDRLLASLQREDRERANREAPAHRRGPFSRLFGSVRA